MTRLRVFVFACLLAVLASPLWAGELRLLQPLGRSAYQTNESILLAVVQADTAAPVKGELTVTLQREGSPTLVHRYPVAAATEHLHLDAGQLRPGKYVVTAQLGEAKASTELEVFSHVRRSSYRLINWGRSTNEQRLQQGDAGYGYNLFYGQGATDPQGWFIRAGVDFVPNCVMSGGHQMDLRMECDWSDPYVSRGGSMRAAQHAMRNRTLPHVPAIHFYDEPGLTWYKDPVTGATTPHGVPSQVAAYQAAFDRSYLPYHQVDAANAQQVSQWKHWATWKLGFMDAAWKEAQFSVSAIKPDYLSLTQSQYGFAAFTDGYYFNVVRSLPVTSGHGGYHDWGPGYFNPCMTLTIARARDLDKPTWYLPTWHAGTTNDQYRLETYLSFALGIQGLMSPPPMDPAINPIARDAIKETNAVMGRLGTIFNTMPATRTPVAMLFSLSNLLEAQVQSLKTPKLVNYSHDTPHGLAMTFSYLAGKLLQHHFMTVVEEDILDGTVAQEHRAVVIGGVSHLDPTVIAALEQYIAGGGVVLSYASTVKINGAIELGVSPELRDHKTTTAGYLDLAAPLAAAIGAQLDKAGIAPVLKSDVNSIIATRHGNSEVDYIFAVNATPDRQAESGITPGPARATLQLPVNGRTVYNAIDSEAVAAAYDFGPGQMRAWALTARPIGSVALAKPIVHVEQTRTQSPIELHIAASVLDNTGGLLAGSIPLRLELIDPSGAVRYDLYRATEQGMLRLSLPLAANDVPGQWKLTVTELLGQRAATQTFERRAVLRHASLAGLSERALFFTGDDRHAFEFVRRHRQVTIVIGSSDYHRSAAERLAKALEPWGVRCSITTDKQAGVPRTISEQEAVTWTGLNYTAKGAIKVGADNPIDQVGFAVEGPVILIGNPQDHTMIAYLAQDRWGYLPFVPQADVLPGRGRGMFAWQRDAVARGVESITLIAHDAAGMSEAVGSFYEAAIGMEPLTRWTLPSSAVVEK